MANNNGIDQKTATKSAWKTLAFIIIGMLVAAAVICFLSQDPAPTLGR